MGQEKELEVAKKKPMTDEERLALAKKLDDELEMFIDGLEKKRYTDGWSEDKWEEEMDKHPFFMKTVSAEGKELPPLVEGLITLKYDPEENTPSEMATNYKEDGNFNFKAKKYRMAIIAYTEGIKQKCDDNDLNATLYQNRATAHFYLQNFRSSLYDSEKALKFAPNYYKAQFRAAKAAFECAKYSRCIELCQKILASKPKDKEVINMLAKAKQKLAIQERDERRKERLNMTKMKPRDELVRAIKDRGIRVYEWVMYEDDYDLKSEYSYLETETSRTTPEDMVHLEDGILHWPVLLCYPEYKVTDTIKGCPENNTLLMNIEQVFPAPWDEEGRYNAGSISVYYEGYNLKLYKVDPKISLKELMVSEYFQVKGGSISLLIVPSGSDCEKRLLNEFAYIRNN